MLTPAQLAERRGLITSSNVAACLALDPRTTPIAAALRAKGASDDEPANAKAIERGNILEDLVIAYAAHERGWSWEHAPFRRHPHHAWAADSTDALYYNDGRLVGLGEAKTAALGMACNFGEPGTDEVPTPCLLQSQWHLAHWPEVDHCYVPVLVGGWQFEFRTYKVTRNQTLIDILLEDTFEFWQRYGHGNELPPAEAGDTEWLKHRFPAATRGRMVADTAEITQLARECHVARQKRQQACEAEERVRNRLRALLGTAEGVRAQWGSITYKNNKASAVVDWRAIAAELAGGQVPDETLARHTRVAPGPRVLRITPKRGIWDD